MKKLLIALMLASSFAYADTAATTGNGNGGITVLTDIPCTQAGSFIVYAQNPKSSTFYGCWWSDDMMVHVTWQDGDIRSYPLSIFTGNPTVLKRMRSNQNKGNV